MAYFAFEKWKKLDLQDEKYSDYYEISNLGSVRCWKYPTKYGPKQLVTPKLLKQKNVRGYRTVSLANKKNYFVHKLVLITFKGKAPVGMESAHEDGVRHNNQLGNLFWKTRKDNHADKIKHGTHQAAENHPRATISNETAEKILIEHYLNSLSRKKIIEMFNVNYSLVDRILSGRSWQNVRPDIKRTKKKYNLSKEVGNVRGF